MPGRQTGSRPHLRLEAVRQCQREAAGDERIGARIDRERLLDGGGQVHAGGSWRRVVGKSGVGRELLNLNEEGRHGESYRIADCQLLIADWKGKANICSPTRPVCDVGSCHSAIGNWRSAMKKGGPDCSSPPRLARF